MGNFIDNTLGTNFFGSNATDDAIDAQKQGTATANQVLAGEYGRQLGFLLPYQQAGGAALGSLSNNSFMNNWQQDPGYQFRLQQGQNAINSSLAARGLGNSGAALKSLTRYGQDFATNEYNNVYNREYNRLSNLANIGQNATNNAVNASANYGGSVSNNYTGLGNAIAGANVAQANQQSNLFGQGLGALGSYFGSKK